jgi:hypothetical protein
MINSRLSLFIITLCIFISISSCNKEVNGIDANQISINKTLFRKNELVDSVKSWFNNAINAKFLTSNEFDIKSYSISDTNTSNLNLKDIEWNKAFISFDTIGKKTLSVPLRLDTISGEYVQLVVDISNKKYTGYFIRSKPDKFYYKVQNNIYAFNNYSGSIFIYDLSGKFLNNLIFEEGQVKNANHSQKESDNFKSFADDVDAELPTVTVVGYINNSGYLVIVPFAAGGSGGEGFTMTASTGGGVFVGGDGSTTSPLRIANFVKDPCLSAIVDKIIDANLGDNLSKTFFSIFNKNEKMNLFFSEKSNINEPGNFQVTYPSIGVANYNIYLNINKMSNSSDQYKASVIVHEIAHAIIRSLYTDQNIYNSLGLNGRHFIMLQNYVSQMKSFLQGNFNLSESEAMSMILIGLGDLNTGITDSQIKNIFYNDYVKIVNYYNFSLVYGDSNYLNILNDKHMKGDIGTKNCQF